jgi:hypothetical protein
MAWVKRWFAVMAVGGTLLAGPTGCVVAPVEPGYVASPPVVVIRPYRAHRHYHYHPHRYYRPYRPYYGWGPYGHRW